MKYSRLAIERHGDWSYWHNLGIAYQSLNRWKDAAEAYQTALKLKHTDKGLEEAIDYAKQKAADNSCLPSGMPEAYLEHLVVRSMLAEMPLFLDLDRHVNLPLESTYMTACCGMPAWPARSPPVCLRFPRCPTRCPRPRPSPANLASPVEPGGRARREQRVRAIVRRVMVGLAALWPRLLAAFRRDDVRCEDDHQFLVGLALPGDAAEDDRLAVGNHDRRLHGDGVDSR